MLVGILKYIKGINKKKVINTFAVFFTMFLMLNLLNVYAADEQVPKLDAVGGYKNSLNLSATNTGDPSSNSETSVGNVGLGFANIVMLNIYPGVYTNYSAVQSNKEIPSYVKGGLVGAADSSIYALLENYSGMNIPGYLASEWVPGYSKSAGIYAASDGYSYLTESNVNFLWDKVRMIAYVFFVVVLLVAGFMIMFRQKIGGQLAISVFNTLPNVIIALIMVTFSFAIVGLTLNFGVMLINIIGSVLGINPADAIQVNNPFSLWGVLLNGDYWKANMSVSLTSGVVTALVGAVIGIFASTGPAGVGVVAGAAIGATLGLLIIAIILSAIVIWASIRVYMTLLTAYLGIILNTILAPGVLALSAFPGQSGMIKDWFFKILKGVLTFPIVFFFLNLGIFILNGSVNIGFPSGIMNGDFSNVSTSGSLVGTLLKSVLVVVLFFFAADAPKVMDDWLVTKKSDGASGAIEGMKKGMSKIPLVGSFFG